MGKNSVGSRSDRGWMVDDYMALDEEAYHELIHGELVNRPTPGYAHQRAVGRIGLQITNHVAERDLGECLSVPIDVVLADDIVVQPDLTFVCAGRFPDLCDGHGVTGAPDLVMEIESPATVSRDRTVKRQIYADAGVPWLVHVDPAARTVEAFEFTDDGHYLLAESASDGDTVELGLFPDLTLDLAGVWLDDDAES